MVSSESSRGLVFAYERPRLASFRIGDAGAQAACGGGSCDNSIVDAREGGG